MQLTDKQKYEIVVRHELGHTNRRIAREMNINRNTVTKWIQKYTEDHNVERNKGSGRFRKTDKQQDNEIINEIKTLDKILLHLADIFLHHYKKLFHKNASCISFSIQKIYGCLTVAVYRLNQQGYILLQYYFFS